MPNVRLNVTHTHAGVAYPAGHVIDVDDHTARWLSARAIGTPEKNSASTATPDVTEVPTPQPRSPRLSLTPKE